MGREYLFVRAGVYNEAAFAGLDHVLDTAASYGIRVIFTMADYWLGVDSFKTVSHRTCMGAPAHMLPARCMQLRGGYVQ